MVSKRRVEIDGTVYLFSDEGLTVNQLAATEIETALRSRRCGRVVGTGISFADPGTYVVEVVSRDSPKAEDVIIGSIERLGIEDYEITWD